MRKLIIFNWKMNPPSLKEATSLFKQTRIRVDRKQINADIVVVPPFVYPQKSKIKNLKLKIGAQNVFWADEGAYTGEISPKMLKNLGVEYVIVGHSERRQYLNETDEMINKKVLAALKAGLRVVLCIGEDFKIHKKGEKSVKNFVKKQLEKDLKNSKFLILNSKLRNHLVIAYEPVWAISASGTGKICKPKDALKMIKYIKSIQNSKFKIHNSKVLYGGSVNGKNIKDFLKYSEIDGALVGGASLKIKEVKEIVEKV